MTDREEGSRLVSLLLSQGLEGVGPLCGAAALGEQFLRDARFPDTPGRVRALILRESAKNFSTSFLTGLGGLPTLPLTLPASVYASWLLRVRLAGAIAHLHSHRIERQQVRELVPVSLLGDPGRELAKDLGLRLGGKVAGKALGELHKRLGLKLISAGGQKLLPLAGSVAGGSLDALECRKVGFAADALFGALDPIG